MTQRPRDIAGADYWDAVWNDHHVVMKRANRVLTKRTNYVDRTFLNLLFDLLTDRAPEHTNILEVGCANSLWLPYLARYGGYRVAGIDYSAVGCDLERKILAACGVDGAVVQGDALIPPRAFRAKFDLVYSYGVVEHFENTASVISAFSRYLKPNGILVTIVPNVGGLNGVLMRLLNAAQLRRHVRLTPEVMTRTHQAAGLIVERSSFFLSLNLGLANLTSLGPSKVKWLRRMAVDGLIALSRVVWAAERVRPFPSHPSVAPYIVCVARGRGSEDGHLSGEGVSGEHNS